MWQIGLLLLVLAPSLAWGAGTTIYTEGGQSAMDEALKAVKVLVVGGGGGGGTQFAEDSAHTSGDLGTMALGVRSASCGTALAGANGDYIPLNTDANGLLCVSATSGFAEDTAHVSGDKGTMALAVRNDSLAALAGTTLDYIPLTTDSVGALWVRETWKTPVGDSLVDDVNDAIRTSVVTVVTTQGKTQITKEWTFTTSKDDFALVAVSAGTIIRVSHLHFTCSNANTVNVDMRIGFATTSLPATTTGGAAKVILSHPGIAPGSGIATSRPGVVEGASNEDLMLTMTVPTSGACRVVADYETI
ncbi:MAG: hypothetical protein ACRDGM_04620 [bacterium]